MKSNPSPQISVQTLTDVESHVYPVSIKHPLEHPSPLKVFPSSHSSVPRRKPSPHIALHVSYDDDVPPLHVYPNSSEQVEEHPSPLAVLPSSQSRVP